MPNTSIVSDIDDAVFEITAFTKTDGPLTKRISLDDNGGLKSDGSACTMARGQARRERFDDLDQFADFIATRKSHEALALGALRDDLPDLVWVATKHHRASRPDASRLIDRTGANIHYRPGRPALALLDVDTKGMPEAVRRAITEAGGYWSALVAVLPELAAAARVARRSTSAGISRADTGEAMPGSDGYHLYVAVKDGADVERFLRALHDRCWLKDLGWQAVGGAGQFLERSLIDRMVYAPERLVFEGAPVLAEPLVQDEASRRPEVFPGGLLDTREACRDLTALERADCKWLKTTAQAPLAAAAREAAELFIRRQTDEIVQRTGAKPAEARRIAAAWRGGILTPSVVLPFDDPELEGATVGDILADPERFEGATLADPLEGVGYGRCKAKVLIGDKDGKPFIASFAHGRAYYQLKHDAQSIEAEIRRADPEEAANVLVALMFDAALEEEDTDPLKALARERTGLGRAPLDTKIKHARQRHADELKRIMRDREAEELEPLDALIAELNDRHFVVNEKGNPVVYTRRHDDILHRRYFDRSSFGQFRNLYLNRTVEGKAGTGGELWLRDPRRHEYMNGVVFDPSGRPSKKGVFNLWEGFGVKPSPAGSWSLLREHIRVVICHNNEGHFNYFMGWMAHGVQHPEIKADVAIVMQHDKEGVGKGIVARSYKRLFGQHGMHIVERKHLTGNFNIHLMDCVYLFADEVGMSRTC